MKLDGNSKASINKPAEARDAARNAALTRFGAVAPSTIAQSSSGKPTVSQTDVKEALKSFARELSEIADYLHYQPAVILAAASLLHDICSKAINIVRTSSADMLKINTTVFERKTQGIKHGQEALVRLGFRDRVVDFKKFAVYEGTFQDDHEAELRFLEQALHAIETCLTGIETHCKAPDKDGKAAAQEKDRQRALQAFQDDREKMKKRTDHAAVVRANHRIAANSLDAVAKSPSP